MFLYYTHQLRQFICYQLVSLKLFWHGIILSFINKMDLFEIAVKIFKATANMNVLKALTQRNTVLLT